MISMGTMTNFGRVGGAASAMAQTAKRVRTS